MSHAGFLRDQHDADEAEVISLVRGLYDAGAPAAQLPQARALQHLFDVVEQAISDGSPSFAPDRSLIRFGLRLAMAPRTMRASRLDPLRAEGWSDREIHDAVNVVACFSYMNRLADGLGVAVDTSEWAVRLLGQVRYEAHRAWADGR